MEQPTNRREVVLGGLLTLACLGSACCTCAADAATPGQLGCYVPATQAPSFYDRTSQVSAFASGAETLEPRSGNHDLDRALAQALSTIAQTFDVLPGFAYFHDDDDNKNAYATPDKRLDRTDGTVLFGLGMLNELLARPEYSDAAIVSVCAHEFGHVVSFKTGLYRKLAPDASKTFRSEQFADVMCGYFAGSRKLLSPSYPAVVFAATVRSFAGSTRGTHGTNDERGAAVAEGFKAAFIDKADLSAGIEKAVSYAMSRT